ncbi:hypothetical protein [Myceligenerans salitolerans]|uniref:Uncharacterized protein n=1 Tax=Myceligenerans salitolerans TaxID=1230528 RepID=A0ABS3I6Y8_9MICO|nr:hypothetical protein [Myceligenerans salitolerans]MBO0607862.1 hypothetical protein [Myceligenerans salitolerans]
MHGHTKLAGKVATGLGGSLLLPFLVELGMASLLDENFSLRRGVLFVGVLGGISALLFGIDRLGHLRARRAEARAAREMRTRTEHVSHHALRPYGPETDGVVALCTARLAPDSLHYLQYHTRGKGIFRVDVLEDPALAPLLGLADADKHRRVYERYGEGLRALVELLDDDFAQLDSGRVLRLVLDVEKGAVFVVEVHHGSGRYLLGVTLDETAVDRADLELRDLATTIRTHLGRERGVTLTR